MKRFVLVAAVLSVCFSSCDKEVPALTRQQIQSKIDSISAARIKENDIRAEKDYNYRMKIELKGKVDSIMNARRVVRDTASKQPVVTQ